jgi:hypothetical protein
MDQVQHQFNYNDPAPPSDGVLLKDAPPRRRRRRRRCRAAAVRLIDRLIDATLATPVVSAAHMLLGKNDRVQVMQGFVEEVEEVIMLMTLYRSIGIVCSFLFFSSSSRQHDQAKKMWIRR